MYFILAMLIAAAITLIPAFLKSGAFGPFVFSALSGLVGLYAVDFISAGKISLIATNMFTVCAALLFGIPGVISMLILRVIALI